MCSHLEKSAGQYYLALLPQNGVSITVNPLIFICPLLRIITSCRRAGGRHDMPPPRPATEACSGSLEPGRSGRARSANTRHPAGRPHTPPGCTQQTSDRRQTASSLNARWAGHNKPVVTDCTTAHITQIQKNHTAEGKWKKIKCIKIILGSQFA